MPSAVAPAIREYAQDIWKVNPVKVPLEWPQPTGIDFGIKVLQP